MFICLEVSDQVERVNKDRVLSGRQQHLKKMRNNEGEQKRYPSIRLYYRAPTHGIFVNLGEGVELGNRRAAVTGRVTYVRKHPLREILIMGIVLCQVFEVGELLAECGEGRNENCFRDVRVIRRVKKRKNSTVICVNIDDTRTKVLIRRLDNEIRMSEHSELIPEKFLSVGGMAFDILLNNRELKVQRLKEVSKCRRDITRSLYNIFNIL